MADDVALVQLQDGIYLAERLLPDGIDVRAALVLGQRRAVVIDTLTCPEDMAGFLALIGTHGRPCVVVNTHSHWDHTWGNAAFPGLPIVGHRLCRERMASEIDREELAQKKVEQPALFANASLLPPDVTFETALMIDLGDLTVELHHVPGHSADSCLAYIPERRLLYGADWAEEPFPVLCTGPLGAWVQSLRAWAERDVETVVPAHGRVGSVALLRANADYLDSLRHAPPLPAGVAQFYADTHRDNVANAQQEGLA